MSSNTNIGNTPVNQGYVQLIHMGETGGIDGTLRALYDGDGTASDLLIASDKVKISTTLYIGSKTLTEFVQDTVGTMFSSNTETNITVTYQDADGTIDLVSSGEVTLTGSETLTNKTLTSPVINTGISGTAFLDEDNMASNSATKFASQQSIKAYVDTEVAGIVDSAPSQLNTLHELATALGDDANYAASTATAIGLRALRTNNLSDLASATTARSNLGLGTSAVLNTAAVSDGASTLATGNAIYDHITNRISGFVDTSGSPIDNDFAKFTDANTIEGRSYAEVRSDLNIEDGATADQSNAEIRTAVEAATDSNVFTDADHSKLNAIEASADVTDTANVTSAGALMDSEVTDLDGIKSLTVPNDTTISATAKTLLDDANVGAMRNTLGLGTLAIKDNIDDIDQIAAGVKLIAGESFVDSDDNLMTAAAIDDRINSAVTASSYSFTLSDGSNTQAIASGNTLTMTGGTGVDVVVGATDTATLTFDGSELPDMTDPFADTDEFIVLDGTTSKRKAANEIRLTNFDDTGFSTITIDGTTANGLLTYGGTNNIDTEANLTFDGDFKVAGTLSSLETVNFDGSSGDTVVLISGTGTQRLEFKDTATGANAWIGIPSWDDDAVYIFGPTSSGNEAAYKYSQSIHTFFTGSTEQMNINSNGAISLSGYTGQDRRIEIGSSRQANGYSFIDLIGDTTYTDFGARFIRENSGPNTGTSIEHRGTGVLSLNAKDAGSVRFYTSNTERVRVDSSGNVGIGNIAPAEKLEISGGKLLVSGGQIRSGSYLEGFPSFSFANDNDTGMFSDTANQLEFSTGGSSRLTINSSGNVGIGTNSPNALLDVGGRIKLTSDGVINWGSAAAHGSLTWDTGFATVKSLGSNDLNLTAPSGKAVVVNEYGSNVDFRVEGDADTHLLFCDAGNDRVGISTDSPSYNLDVNRADAGIIAQFQYGTDTDGRIQIYADANAGSIGNDSGLAGETIYFQDDLGMRFYTHGSETMRLTTAGDVTISRGSLTLPVAEKLYFGASNHTYIGEDVDDRLRFFTGGAEFMRFTVSGGSNITNIQNDTYFGARALFHSGNFSVQHDTNHAYISNNVGNMYIRQQTNDADLVLMCDNGSGADTAYITLDGSTVRTDFDKPIEVNDGAFFADSSVAYFGAGNDLRLFHDSSNSYVYGYGTGNLQIGHTIADADTILVGDNGSGSPTPYLTLDGSATDIKIAQKMQFPASHSADKIVMYSGGNEKIGTEANTLLFTSDNYKFKDVAGHDNLFMNNSGNVGIGTTSPGYKLDVVGTSRTDALIIDGGGTYAAGSIYSDSNWGMLFRAKQASPGQAEFRWANSADSELMRIDSSGRLIVGHTAGIANVGGTAHLQVLGTGGGDSTITIGRFSNNASAPELLFTKSRGSTIGTNTIVADGDSCGSILWGVADGGDTMSYLGMIEMEVDGTPGANDTPGRMMFKTTADGAAGATERMRITSAGNVGIGETSPEAKLHIKNASAGTFTASNSQLLVENNTTVRLTLLSPAANGCKIEFGDINDQDVGMINYDHSNNYMAFTTNAAERMRIDSTGNVGIGTTSPYERLYVQCEDATSPGIVSNPSQTNGVVAYAIGYGDADKDYLCTWGMSYSAGANVFGFGVKPSTTADAEFISSGDNANFVRGALYFDNELRFFNAGAGSGYALDSAVSMTERFRVNTSGTGHFDGDVVAYSSTVSDKRLKENITTIDNALDKVMALRGVEYDWTATARKGTHDIGLVAQEVEEVIPELVTEHELCTGEFSGEGNEKIFKTVNYDKIVGVLIEAIKEQQEQINELKTKIGEQNG